jgi:hypothetical protein
MLKPHRKRSTGAMRKESLMGMLLTIDSQEPFLAAYDYKKVIIP